MNPTILIVDDEKHTREGIRASLEESFEVYVAADIQGAMNVLEADRIDLLVTDLRLGAEDGMKLIDHALAMPFAPVCIMMTAYGSVDTAVEAMKHGAYDFVTKPLNLDKLEILIRRALKSREMEKENVVLRQQVNQQYGLENIIGQSLAMDDIFKVIRQVSPSRANVLIQGESGTGKELVAHAIHNLSGRNKSKFVAVHCAALSPQLLESELFGHEKGSFTGASEKRIGRFEQADGGTLFLDEIGEIDANTQIKLLRAVSEERAFERVGGNLPIKVDVRLVAATNKNLEKLVAEGKFRDDLFYRLNVVQITMPPLRDRNEDIPMLANAFLKKFAKENEKPVRQLDAEAMEALLGYGWPGNVRELRTVIEHGVVMAVGETITLRDLPSSVRLAPQAAPGAALGAKLLASSEYLNLHESEQRIIIKALNDCKGNVTAAAKKLGISRRTLQRKKNQLGGKDT